MTRTRPGRARGRDAGGARYGRCATRYQRIDAVAKIGGTLRVLDLTEPSVRAAVATATVPATLYEGPHATDY